MQYIYVYMYMYNKLPQNKTIIIILLNWGIYSGECSGKKTAFIAESLCVSSAVSDVFYSTVNLLHNHCIFSVYINRYIINLIHIYISKYTVILQ